MSDPFRRAPARTPGPWLFRLLLCLVLAVAAVPSFAQTNANGGTTDFDAVLDLARKQVDTIQKSLRPDTPDADLVRMRTQALEIQANVEDAATKIEPLLVSVDARLTELGKPAEGTTEAPDVAAQRAQLGKTRTALDAQVKLARLLSVEAEQAAAQISRLRAASFQAQLGERTSSVLSGRFWSDLRSDLPRDLTRLRSVGNALADGARATPVPVWLAVIAGMLVVLGARIWGGRRMLQFSAAHVPAGRLRRSLHALVLLLLSTLTTTLLAELIAIGLRANTAVDDDVAQLLGSAVGALAFSGYVSGLGIALLSPDRPSWRVPPLDDEVVHRVRWLPVQLAVVMVFVWGVERVLSLANVSLITTVAANAVVGLALCLFMGRALLRVERYRRQRNRTAGEGEAVDMPLWIGMLGVAWTIALAVSLVALLSGYVALGSFIVKQISWTLVVLSSAYLFGVLIDDGFMALRGMGRVRDEAGQTPADVSPRARDQAAVLLSGVCRVALGLVALMLLLAQFGQGPTELLGHVDVLQQGVQVGEINIRPTAMLQALAVLVIGVVIVRLLKHWLGERFLPTTRLDAGMRVSTTSLFGYFGYVVAVSVALSSVGIGLDRIAWVASALSVGIGFGLQAVVQNFVSGLILLAERPVKVGDWVALGGVEGDIRRINVRATEIQMGDRSTVIVPNSEFITKTVRNVTHTNPIGLVNFKLPLPLDTDPDQARALILGAFKEHGDVLDTPAPNVQLDSIDGKSMLFNCSGFAASPRLAYGVKSALLFEVIRRLRHAGIALHAPQTMVFAAGGELVGQPAPPAGPVVPPTTAAPRDAT